MNNPARRREVTADGMTRVAAVVASLVEASESAEQAPGNLTDLIAKAAQEVEQHASATRILRTRGLTYNGNASESLRSAKGGADPAGGQKLNVVR